MARGRKKWKKIVGWSLGIIVILLVAGTIALNYAVNYVLDSMVGDLEEQWQSENGSNHTGDPIQEDPQDEDTHQDTGGQTDTDGQLDSDGQSDSDGDKSGAGSQGGSGQPGERDDGTWDYSAGISTDKAVKVQENITVKEKARLAAVILKHFSPSEVQLFMDLASGGLSVEEKKSAKKLFLDKLSESEYNELIAIAAKYGLSQGKDYNSSLKE